MVLLLNSDTVVHRGCLAYCAGVLDKDGTIGALSCRLLNADGSLQVAARRFQSPLRLLVGATGLPWALPRIFGWAQIEYRGWDMERDAGDPDWIGGAFMMIPRSVVDEIGLFDESFFFYGEDQEYCHRVWASGRRVHYDPHATTTHLGGSSSDPSRMKSEARSRAVWRARYLFLCRRYGVLPMLAVRIADIGMLAGRTIVSHLTGGRESGRKVELRTAWQCVVSKLGPM
jgi:GT2 family glycosyltransferase